MSERENQAALFRDTFHSIKEVSKILQTGLDSETLSICVKLCELGVDPKALAAVIKELRRMVETDQIGPTE